MPTKMDLFNQLKIDLAKGEGQHMVHLVDHVAEQRRKRTNPSKSTRVMLNCRTPEQWSEFQLAKERFFEICSDPHIALDMMIRSLKAPDEATLRVWLAEGHTQEGDRPPGPPKAEIPEPPPWIRE